MKINGRYLFVGHRSFLLTSNQLRKRKTMTQEEATRSPHQMLLVSPTPQPRSMMSLMAWTVMVWGSSLTKVTIQAWGIPSSGQMIPHSSMWGKQAPMLSFIASVLVLQMVERKNPKLIPARPLEENIMSESEMRIFYESNLPWNKVSTTNHAIGP